MEQQGTFKNVRYIENYQIQPPALLFIVFHISSYISKCHFSKHFINLFNMI